MADYPFNLRGQQGSYRGRGRKDGETEKSAEFSLRQGVLIAEIEHHGQGDFKLEFVPTEGMSLGRTTAASVGGGAATGAVAGSIIPVAGTLAGSLIGAGVGWLASEVFQSDKLTVEQEGAFSMSVVAVVNDIEDEECLRPGKYRLEVEASSGWACQFIQPDLGQALGPLLDDNENESGQECVEGGIYVIGPLTSGSRPIVARLNHRGREGFLVTAYSVDGTHQCDVYEDQGQFLVEDIPTDIKPGKEYMFLIEADGDWDVGFTEGY